MFDWNRKVNDHLINDLHTGFHYFQFQILPYYANEFNCADQPAPGSITVGEPYNEPEIFRSVHPAIPGRPVLGKGKAQS